MRGSVPGGGSSQPQTEGLRQSDDRLVDGPSGEERGCGGELRNVAGADKGALSAGVRQYRDALQDIFGSMEGPTEIDGNIWTPYKPEVNHYTAHGAYARQMYLPKGGVVIGAEHRFEGINVVALGMAGVMNVADDSKHIYVSGQVFVAPPHSQRVLFALEDLVWVNIFAHDYTDEETFLKEFVCQSG